MPYRLSRAALSLAGAAAAAAREMRPVEIVGLYERQREGLEAELGAAKSEVRGTRVLGIRVY